MRGVPPSRALLRTNFTANSNTPWRLQMARQLQVALRLADEDRWAALFAARVDSATSARRSMSVPWRERPPFLTGGAVSPATRGGRSRHAVGTGAGLIGKRLDHPITAQTAVMRMKLVRRCHVFADCEAIKALRVAPPALRAADGLDRAAFECGLVSSRSRANRSTQGCKHLSGNVARKRGGLALGVLLPLVGTA